MKTLFDLPEETPPTPKQEKRFYMFVSDNGIKFYAYRPRHDDQHRYTYDFLPEGDETIGKRSKVKFTERGIKNAVAYWRKKLKQATNRFLGSEEVK